MADTKSSTFLRNVMTVASGAAMTQAITIAFSPLITRLYGPEIYGLQSLFMSITGIAATAAALNYPTAIVLPKSDSDAKAIARISIYLGVISSLLVAAIFLISEVNWLEKINAAKISELELLIPIAMLAGVASSILGQWLIREKSFNIAARYGVLTTLLTSLTKTGLGFLHPTAHGLITTNILGNLIGSLLAYVAWKKQNKKINSNRDDATLTKSTLDIAKEHRDFPLLRTPQNLINGISQGAPLMLLASLFGATYAGQYGIALTVLGIPAALIGNSVMSVFYPRITDAIHNKENPKKLIIRATLGMAMVGAAPFLAIVAAGPTIFSFAFGSEWKNAGTYAQLLAPWLFLQFINRPAVAAIPALKIQKGLLVYEVFSTGTKLIALWAGFQLFQSDWAAVALFSLAGVIAYIWLIKWVLQRCPQHLMQTRPNPK